MNKLGMSLALAAVLQAQGCRKDEPDAQDPYVSLHTSWRRVRVAVADLEVGGVSIIDAEDEEVIARVELSAPVRLASSHTGNFGLLLGAGGVGFLSSGVAIVDHVDHIHVYKSQPRVHAFTLGGATPRSVVSSYGWVAALDGTGATVVEEQSLLGPNPQPRTMPISAAGSLQAVVALPGRALLLDTGMLRVRDLPSPGTATGADREVVPCGEAEHVAVTLGRVALPCREGLTVIEPPQDPSAPLVTESIPYPAGARPRSLRLHPARPAIVGDSGRRRFLIAYPKAVANGTPATLTPDLPADACAFGVEQRDGSRIVVLGADGVLRDLPVEASDAAGVRSTTRLVAQFTCDDPAGPALALAPERAYVSDPTAGVVHDIDLRTMRRVRSYPVGGKPGPLAILGLDLKNANVAPGAEHPDDAGVLDASSDRAD